MYPGYPLLELRLTSRTRHALTRNDTRKGYSCPEEIVEDLKAHGLDCLLAIHLVGHKSVVEILDALQARGYLSDEERAALLPVAADGIPLLWLCPHCTRRFVSKLAIKMHLLSEKFYGRLSGEEVTALLERDIEFLGQEQPMMATDVPPELACGLSEQIRCRHCGKVLAISVEEGRKMILRHGGLQIYDAKILCTNCDEWRHWHSRPSSAVRLGIAE